MKEYKFEGLIGDNTTVDLLCEWTPGQKEILHPAENSQEGFPEELSVYAVLLNGDDIFNDLAYLTIIRLEESAQEQFDEISGP